MKAQKRSCLIGWCLPSLAAAVLAVCLPITTTASALGAGSTNEGPVEPSLVTCMTDCIKSGGDDVTLAACHYQCVPSSGQRAVEKFTNSKSTYTCEGCAESCQGCHKSSSAAIP